MKRGKKKREFSRPKVPAYLVSFGDMMTILLTFFILLCTYATTKTAGFVADGIGSFQSAIEAMGLPGFLTSDRQPISLGADRIRYQSKDREDKGERAQDTRRISDEREVLQAAKIRELGLGEQLRLDLSVSFLPGTAELAPGHEETLRSVSGIVGGSSRRLEVIGHSERESLTTIDRLRLGMRRAAKVVRLLQEEYGAPEGSLSAGTTAISRAGADGAVPDGDITLRIYRPGDRDD